MNLLQPLFAQDILNTDVSPGASRWMGLSLTELMMVLGAVSVVTLCIFIWAAYIRKRPRERSHRHHHRSHSQADPNGKPASFESEQDSERRYRKKRRRRREHRPRNPTLAETGGLPPLRTERPVDPLP